MAREIASKTEFPIKATFMVDLEFLEDVLVTAVEGGINYWASVGETSYPDLYSNIKDKEDRDQAWKIGRSTLVRGIRRIVNGQVGIRSDLKRQVVSGAYSNDAGEIDADAADCIIQAGLFNELVYG